MDNINSAISFLKDIGPTAWKYVIYETRPDDYVSEFQEMQGKLKRRLSDVDANLKTQLEQPRKRPKKEVEAWQKKARLETAENVVEDLICREGFFTNIRSSRKLDEKTQELNLIFMEGENYSKTDQSLVVDDHSIKGVPLLVEKCHSRDDTQRQILEWLKGDHVTRIAVWGMGGVGKTTIMRQVHNQLLKESKFNKVFWVKVSKDFDIIVQQKTEFDILKFQKRIASTLDIKLGPGDHENGTKLAELISQRLGQGSNVLILDDVWQQFRLEDVGIPDLIGNNGCKLVLTTRLQNVARAMDCEVIPVDPLPLDEALALFLEKVGSDVLSDGKIKRDIEPFFKQILQKCHGVPLAIVTVAKSMRGKPHLHSWKLALSEFNEFKGIIDCLKFSYDYMEEPLCQECFLYCALYPEGYEIPKEELIEYWIEEGLIYKEGKNRQIMNWKGHDILDKLVNNCLLESVKKKHKDCVSMHDLLREMALDNRPQILVKAGMGLKRLPEEHEWREDLLKVSLMKNHIKEIPSDMPSPKCTMLTTLLLSNNEISTISEAFFNHMRGLKILDLSNNPELSRLPSSVSKLEKLTTLLLRGCKSLREVPFLSNFGDLKKLDLLGTSIEEVPHGLNMLTNLKYLCLGRNLSVDRFGRILHEIPDGFAGRLSEIPDGLLQTLSKLQHLEVDYSIPLRGEEIGRLGKLEYLKGRFPTLHEMSSFFNSREKILNMYNVFVGSYPKDLWRASEILIDQKVNFIMYCDIDICEESNWLPSNVQRLEIWSCKDVRSLNDIPGFQDTTDLQSVDIRSCDEMKFVLSLSCYSRCNPGTFSPLKHMNVCFCNKINKLFPVRWLWYLQNLVTIRVESCKQIEEILWSEYEGGEQVTLPKLESLSLENLPQLKSIYSGSSSVLICNSIKKIHIQRCQRIESVIWSGFNPLPTLEDLNLQNLNLKSVFDGEALGLSPDLPPTTPFSLKTIFLSNCNQLRKVFSSGWLLSYFQFLETIDVSKCQQMEELILSSADDEERVTLPKLERLSLEDLTQLKSIYSSPNSVLICNSIKKIYIQDCLKIESVFGSGFNPLPTLEDLYLQNLNLKSVFNGEALGLSPALHPTTPFSLKIIKIHGCDQLKKVFSSGWLLSYFQSLKTINVSGCKKMEELISSSTYEEARVTLPNLQALELTELPKLKSICSRSSVLICDSIKSLWIVSCEKLERIPLNFGLLDNAPSSHPPSLKVIWVFPKEWWESLEWDHPNAKDILSQFCSFVRFPYDSEEIE